MKKLFVLFVTTFGSTDIQRNRGPNENCIDYSFWQACSTICNEHFIDCITNCESDQDQSQCVSQCNRESVTCESACPCGEKCPFGCTGCGNDICFQKYGAIFVMNSDIFGVDPDGKNAWLLDRDAYEIDGLNFELGAGTDLFAACATSFKGNMFLFGGVTVNNQVSKIDGCALRNVGELPFILEKGSCQARLDDQVMLCFSGHESSDDYRDKDGPGTKTCWQFDEVDGEYKYTNQIPDTEFGHKHNPMAMYDENPLAIGSCWGLEVEMFDRIERKWLRLDDFPNPGGYGNEVFDTISLEDRVYTFGGYWKNGTFGDHVYQFKDYKWSLVANMIKPRGASVALRFDREVFIIGGYPNAEFYPVETEKWLLNENDDLIIGTYKFTGTPIDLLVYPLVFLVPADFCLSSSVN